MGVAILSGVLESLDTRPLLKHTHNPKWESHTPGTSTPAARAEDDPALPSRFLACVSREESAKRLRSTFLSTGVEVVVGENVRAVQEADVILLWCD
jgi:pyrroline-5-carboxylate reductase